MRIDSLRIIRKSLICLIYLHVMWQLLEQKVLNQKERIANNISDRNNSNQSSYVG